MNTHLIRTLPVLTVEQCNEVLEASKDHNLLQTTIFGTQGECVVDPNIRNNTMICVDDKLGDYITKLLHNATMNALMHYRDQVYQYHYAYIQWPMPEIGYTQIRREKFQMLSYTEDQHYSWHFDQAVTATSPEKKREFSMVLYLTDDFDGGYTWFPYTRFRPRIGEALFFPSNWCFPHCSEKVTRGDKRVIVTWFQVDYTPQIQESPPVSPEQTQESPPEPPTQSEDVTEE